MPVPLNFFKSSLAAGCWGAGSAPSVGYCNTMDPATMNALAEGLGRQMLGTAEIPAPYRESGQMSYETSRRIVDRVREDPRPDRIMTREAVEGRAVVFDGPKGYPGGAEVVNTRPPAYLLRKGVEALSCVGDGRQSGSSGSPSILNASSAAAAGGGIALLKTGGNHQQTKGAAEAAIRTKDAI